MQKFWNRTSAPLLCLKLNTTGFNKKLKDTPAVHTSERDEMNREKQQAVIREREWKKVLEKEKISLQGQVKDLTKKLED